MSRQSLPRTYVVPNPMRNRDAMNMPMFCVQACRPQESVTPEKLECVLLPCRMEPESTSTDPRMIPARRPKMSATYAAGKVAQRDLERMRGAGGADTAGTHPIDWIAFSNPSCFAVGLLKKDFH